ncbi:hypothetical protein [Halioxenophilus aromaticivorans]|uniref:Uncharacterized protein n=1 Tax=Halioxenophilus aromaticivorans TaxID=1306992 RepID=A0AAV3TZA2_9ALTE
MSDYFYREAVFYFSLITVALGGLEFLHTIYFQVRYQKKVDVLINGDNYIDGGWIFNASRMMMYAHYCLFPKRAERAGVEKAIHQIPVAIKWHLIVHWVAVILVCFLAAIAYLCVRSIGGF